MSKYLNHFPGVKSFEVRTKGSKSRSHMMDIPEIRVTFKDGKKDTFVLQHYVALPYSPNLDPTQLCNYIGFLKHEPGSVVAVTGCLDNVNSNEKIYITMLSERSIYQKNFVIDKQGNFEPIIAMDSKHDKSRSRDDDEFVEGDEIGDIEEEEEAHTVILGAENKVPFAIKVKLKIGVDMSARKTIVNRLETTVDQWISDVVTHLQAVFHHPTLHHRVNFEVGI